MKKVILSAVAITAVLLTGCKSETKSEQAPAEETVVNAPQETGTELAMATFGVRGNCSMCKATIEKAATSVEGVAKAEWDVNKKKIDISFDASKTNAEAVKNAIAAFGYDAEGVTGNEEAFKELPSCCQYDRNMTMNQEGGTAEGHEGHEH